MPAGAPRLGICLQSEMASRIEPQAAFARGHPTSTRPVPACKQSRHPEHAVFTASDHVRCAGRHRRCLRGAAVPFRRQAQRRPSGCGSNVARSACAHSTHEVEVNAKNASDEINHPSRSAVASGNTDAASSQVPAFTWRTNFVIPEGGPISTPSSVGQSDRVQGPGREFARRRPEQYSSDLTEREVR